MNEVSTPAHPRRYLALCFPRLPSERLRLFRPDAWQQTPDAPLVLVARAGNAIVLAAVDARAAELGLAPGLALADARARLPDLLVHDADPQADAHWLKRLAAGCVRYTPTVAIDPPDAILLEIAGAAHLSGGEAGLAATLTKHLQRRGMKAEHAFASHPDAALALARFLGRPADDEDLAVRGLPVAALRLPPASEAALRRAGLHRVGDIAARPMANLAARFGAEATLAVRRMLGEAESPLSPIRFKPLLRVEQRFAEPVSRTDTMLVVLLGLCGILCGKLLRHGLGGRRFAAAFFRSDGHVAELAIDTSQPCRDPALMMRLFGEALEALADPLDPGFGFDRLRLIAAVTEPLASKQLRLEGGPQADVQLAELIDRLGARNGIERIRRLQFQDSHVPELAQSSAPAMHGAATGQWPTAPPGEPPLRPVQLFFPPQRITVLAEVPDGPPWRFSWRRRTHQIARAEGPERIAPLWWRRRNGTLEGGLTRDYFRVEDSEGGRFWIFRHGLYGGEKALPDWYLHGLFA